MKIAAIILNYNSSQYCKICASFLLKQENVDLEIIVVDNCSKEEEAKAVKTICDELGLTLLCAKENRGYSAGNNIGLRYAAEIGCKYALIANPDMEFYQSNYICELIKVMERDAQVIVCCSDIVDIEGTHQNPLYMNTYWDDFWGVLKTSRKRYEREKRWKESRYCDLVHGCCMMLNVEFIKSIDYLDENTFLYCEERILGTRIKTNNKKMYYYAAVQAVHHHVKSEKGNSRRNLNMLLESRDYFYKQYTCCTKFERLVLKLAEYFQFYMIFMFSKLKINVGKKL